MIHHRAEQLIVENACSSQSELDNVLVYADTPRGAAAYYVKRPQIVTRLIGLLREMVLCETSATGKRRVFVLYKLPTLRNT